MENEKSTDGETQSNAPPLVGVRVAHGPVSVLGEMMKY